MKKNGEIRHCEDLVYHPSKLFSALHTYCSRISVVLLSYNSRSTLIRLDCKKIGRAVGVLLCDSRSILIRLDSRKNPDGFFPKSDFPSIFYAIQDVQVDLLSYESQLTDKRDNYNYLAETKMEGLSMYLKT